MYRKEKEINEEKEKEETGDNCSEGLLNQLLKDHSKFGQAALGVYKFSYYLWSTDSVTLCEDLAATDTTLPNYRIMSPPSGASTGCSVYV
jgi:hypothetical protein